MHNQNKNLVKLLTVFSLAALNVGCGKSVELGKGSSGTNPPDNQMGTPNSPKSAGDGSGGAYGGGGKGSQGGAYQPKQGPVPPPIPVTPTVPTVPTLPVDPSVPTVPTDPVNPFKPIPNFPPNPTDPTNPNGPFPPNPPDITDPSHPTNPNNPPPFPTDPTLPTDPSLPTDPTDPTVPIDPSLPPEPFVPGPNTLIFIVDPATTSEEQVGNVTSAIARYIRALPTGTPYEMAIATEPSDPIALSPAPPAASETVMARSEDPRSLKVMRLRYSSLEAVEEALKEAIKNYPTLEKKENLNKDSLAFLGFHTNPLSDGIRVISLGGNRN